MMAIHRGYLPPASQMLQKIPTGVPLRFGESKSRPVNPPHEFHFTMDTETLDDLKALTGINDPLIVLCTVIGTGFGTLLGHALKDPRMGSIIDALWEKWDQMGKIKRYDG